MAWLPGRSRAAYFLLTARVGRETAQETSVLKSFSDRLSSSARQRHLFFLGMTLLAIVLIGYHFGTFDQAIHIPFLKKYADPSLFPDDKFFDLRFQHYSYFWFFFKPFYKLGILEIAVFVTHGLATYLTLWALWNLSDTLFHNSLASTLSVVALAFPHLGFAGFPLLEFSLLNRTFVLPFLLCAITLFLRRRYLLAFALLGALYNLHVISANFVLAMFLFDCLVEFRTIGWKNIFLGIILFGLTALPVLIWKLSGSRVDLSPQPEWFSIIARGTLYNLFYLIAPYPHILLATLSGLSTLALFGIGRRRLPSSGPHPTVTYFVYAALIILGVQAITAEWYPATLIVQSQIIRAGMFVLVFGYLYFANYLAEKYQAEALSRTDFNLLAGTFIAATFPLAPVIVWGIFERVIASVRWRQLAAAGALVGFFGLGIGVGVVYGLWYPGIYIFPHHTAWYDAQRWARDHTPKDTVFITPPQIWWFYESDWRVFSERSTVSTHSELLEAAFAPEYISYWKPRFAALAPGALERFQGDFFENYKITARAFYTLSSDQLLAVAERYGAAYLVVEKPHLHDFPKVYENAQFVIYDLRKEK